MPLIDGGIYSYQATEDPEFMVSDYRIPNQGMPISKTPGERGDLIVRTSVQYPQTSKIENMSESDKRIFEAVL